MAETKGKLRPTFRYVLQYLVDKTDWASGYSLPDGNGRAGGARGEVLSEMRRLGLIEYGKEPKRSHYGWRITEAGRTALANGGQHG